MIKYTLNGEAIEVDPKDEKQFKIDNPKAEKTESGSSTFGEGFANLFDSKPINAVQEQALEDSLGSPEESKKSTWPQFGETDQSQDNQQEEIIEEKSEPVKITDEERERIDILEQEADPSLEVPTTEVPPTEIDPIDESLKQTQEQIDYYEGLELEPDYSYFGVDYDTDYVWGKDTDTAINLLNTQLGDSYIIADATSSLNPRDQKIRITHKDSKEEIILDVGITLDAYQDKKLPSVQELDLLKLEEEGKWEEKSFLGKAWDVYSWLNPVKKIGDELASYVLKDVVGEKVSDITENVTGYDIKNELDGITDVVLNPEMLTNKKMYDSLGNAVDYGYSFFVDADTKQKYKEDLILQNAKDLSTFLDKSLSEDDKIKLDERSEQYLEAFEEHQKNWDLSEDQQKEIDNLINPNRVEFKTPNANGTWESHVLFSQTEVDNFEKNNPDAIKLNSIFDSYPSSVDSKATIKPYKKELEEAKKLLQRNGNENPTEDEIKSVALHQIVTNKKNDIFSANITSYMKDEIKPSTISYLIDQYIGSYTGESDILKLHGADFTIPLVTQLFGDLSEEAQEKLGIDVGEMDEFKIGAMIAENKEMKEYIELQLQRAYKEKEVITGVKLVNELAATINDPNSNTGLGDIEIRGSEDIYKEIGVLLEPEFKSAVDNIYNENHIVINGVDIGSLETMTQDDYNIGAQKIVNKYTDLLPSEDDQKKYLDDIQSKITNGSITYDQGLKMWEDYSKKANDSADVMNSELADYDNQFQTQQNNISALLNELQDGQNEKLNIANAIIDKQNLVLDPDGDGIEDYIKLENGKIIDRELWDNYNIANASLTSLQDDLEKFYDEELANIMDLPDGALKNELIQRNYSNVDKFMFTWNQGMEKIVVGVPHAIVKLGTAIVGQDNSAFSQYIDERKYEYDKVKNDLWGDFQEDVKFANAFDSPSNFGKFALQEIATQGPQMAMAVFGGGLGMVGGIILPSFSDNWSRMVAEEIENPMVEHTAFKKVIASTGYAAAEGVDFWIQKFGISKAFRAFSGARKGYLATGMAGFRNQLMKEGGDLLLFQPMLEIGGEGLTTIIQNGIEGEPWNAHLDHAMFSAGMFSVSFGAFGISGGFMKGRVAASFANEAAIEEFRSNLKEIDSLVLKLQDETLTEKGKDNITREIEKLASINENMLQQEFDKIDNMSEEFTDTFFDLLKKEGQLKNEYYEITNTEYKSKKEKNDALKRIEEDFAMNQALLTELKNNPAFGDKFLGFTNSTKEADISRKEKLFSDARIRLESGNQLFSKGKKIKNPTQEQINDEARLEYNIQEIQADLNASREGGLLENFQSYDTKENAIAAINAIDDTVLPPKEKEKAIDGIKNGNHGSDIALPDGSSITFQVVENMALDNRLSTRTHEMGHQKLRKIFGDLDSNAPVYQDIANSIEHHLLNNDLGSWIKLKTRTQGIVKYDADGNIVENAEEVLANFMELVTEGDINLTSINNKKLPSLLGKIFSNTVFNRTKGKTKLKIEGANDAVSFITTLAKKIKDGTIDITKVKESKFAQTAKAKYAETKKETAKETKIRQKLSNNPMGAIRDLIPGNLKTNKQFKRWIHGPEGSKIIGKELYSDDGFIWRVILRDANYNEDLANKTRDKIVSRIWKPEGGTSFNPETIRKKDGKPVGPKAFVEHIFFAWTKDRIGSVKKMFEEGKFGPTQDVSGDTADESGRTVYDKIESGDLNPEELHIAKEKTPTQLENEQETLSNLLKTDQLKTEIVDALKLAFGTKLPELSTKQDKAKLFKKELFETIKNKLKTKIQKKLGTELAYNEFIKNELPSLLKFIPDGALRDMEKMVGGKRFPNGKKILATQVRLTEVELIKDLQYPRGPVPMTFDKYYSGFNLPIRLPDPTAKELLAFFRGTNAKEILGYEPAKDKRMLGTRKDKLAELLTIEIAKDYAMEVTKDPDVLEKIKSIANLQDIIVNENWRAELGVVLDRDPDAGSVNIKNSQKSFSRKDRKILIEQVELLTELIKEHGVDNVIDSKTFDFLLLSDNENISALAISKALEISNSGVLEQGKATLFKQGIFKSKFISESIKKKLKDQGTLRNADWELKDLYEANIVISKKLGPEIMKLMGYDIFGFYNRMLDPAKRKVKPEWKNYTKEERKKLIKKHGKDYRFQRDKNGDFVSGKWHKELESLKTIVNNLKNVKLPKGLKLEDIELMNKKFSLFSDIQDILDQNIPREKKLEQLAKLQPRIEAANVANIALAKHISKTIINAARNKEISELAAINLLQLQTNAIGGLRALTRLDGIEVLTGSQIMSKDHPLFKKALEYEKNKGKLKAKGGLTFVQMVIKKLTGKGEHVSPNANTMVKLAELIGKDNIDIDNELDIIFNDHSQVLATKHTLDVVDDGPGGTTSTAGFSRFNILKPKTLNNIVGIDGSSFQDVRADREISKLAKIVGINAKNSKSASMYKATDNLIKFSKKPEASKIKGMSTFDFDDTLARTKSGVRYTMPNNTGKPMTGKKVIFLAGSAGSGKSNVVKQLGLEKQGFKMVNQDISLEWLSKNNGLPTNMRDFTPEQSSKWGSLQWEARDIAQRKAMKFRGRGDGVVVDGTGASTISMFTQAQKYKDAGYDVQMLFVDSSLDTALERNKNRKERSLQDFIVERNWKAVQKNKKAFKEEFGGNFTEVNTDKLKQGDPMPKSLVNKINKFTTDYIKGRLTAEEFASKGSELLEQGAKFDFSEFNKVVDGTPGPLLKKARNRAKKYGTKDMFVLTARPQQSAFAIQQFLKGQGLDIPIKNITGLANSTGSAKAQWMLDKFAEGYNDMYFVDDAIQNVEAVKQVLDQLDIKSEVVQARIKFSKNASKEFNTIIEESQGTKAEKVISQAAAKKLGKHKGWWRIFVPASAEDFKGLMYRFLGKGEQGDRHMAWFKDHLFDPFAKGIRSWNNYKQGMVNEYKALKKEFKDIKKSLNTKVKGTDFTAEQAVRVYLWDKAGFEVPGLDNETKSKLISHVLDNTRLKIFADTLSKITRTEDGYVKPRQGWSIGAISNDLNDIVNKIGRKQFLAEYIANAEAIFTPENMNKIEALYGTGYRNALENILYRMENGGNRRTSEDKNVNRLLGWINGSVGAIMFFNMRSALLQTISTVNFINWNDNNLFKASAAFANQKQFWKDFVMLFNSSQLKQRRAGIQIDVSASELSRAFAEGKGTPQGVISWLLEKGFTPTQVADSFAIAFGGASFYRNRYNTYINQGMSRKDANEKTMLEFQEIAEETQQSSREDLISQQQASVLGRVVLAFQNVTMQYTRLTKKSLSDLVNRRGDAKTNISKIIYYGAVQNIIFLSLQSALAAFIWGDEDDEEIDKKTKQVINGSLDSFLSGMGLHGAIVKTIKNTISVYKEEKEKGWNREDGKILLELMSFSPPIGSKLRKIWNALKTEQYNEGVSEELGWRIENPNLYYWASIIEAATNIPTQRLVKKANNIEEAITGNHLMWQRIMLGLGWSAWTIGVEDEELQEAKEKVKEKKEIEKEEKKKEDKIIKEKEKEEEKIKEEEEKKEKGIKTIRCSGIRSNGERCGNTTETSDKTWLCYHHAEFTDGADRDGDGIKEYRCTAIKNSGERCKNKTENKNKKCYAHQ